MSENKEFKMIEDNGIEQTLYDVLNEEIAKELLREHDPEITDEYVNSIYSRCINGNPFDAVIIYELDKIHKNERNE